MKKKNPIILLSSAAITLLLASCGNQPDKRLVGIDFDMGNKNYTYSHGDDFFTEFEGIGMMIPDIYACYSDGSKKLLSDTELANVTFTGYQENTLAVQPIVVHYKENNVDVFNTYDVKVVPEGTPIIDVQPVDQIGKYPDAKEFTIKVRNSDDMKYQWLINAGTRVSPEGGLEETYKPLDGITATTDKLTIPSVDCSVSYAKFACDVTSISKNITVRSEPVVYYLTNYDDFVHCAYMGEYAITPGTTLDLSNTPYGSGTISLADNGLDYTFNDVHFKNDEYTAGSLLSHEAFGIINYNNQDENISITFNGENVIDNVLWDDDINAGGTAFNFNFLGADAIEPTITFNGPGTLEIKGGSNALHADCDIVFDLDVKLSGVENRLTKGIICQNFTLKEGRSIDANIGGSIIFTEGSDSTLTLEDNSVINGLIKPGKVKYGGTLTYGIASSGYLKINNATVDLDIVANTDYIATDDQFLNPVVGLRVSNIATEITGSTIDIDITSTNNTKIVGYEATGISTPNLGVDSSTININIDSNAFFNSYAISSANKVIIRNDSKINAEVKTLGYFGGINVSQADSSITISNSQVTLKGSARVAEPDFLFFNVGLKADNYNFDLGDNGFVDIDTVNGLALASKKPGSTVSDPVTPVTGYTPECIDLDALNVTFDKEVEVNLSSYTNGSKYVPVETLYAKGDLSSPISKIRFIK